MYRLSANGKVHNLLKGLPIRLETCGIAQCKPHPSRLKYLSLEGLGKKILEVTPKLDVLQGKMYNSVVPLC